MSTCSPAPSALLSLSPARAERAHRRIRLHFTLMCLPPGQSRYVSGVNLDQTEQRTANAVAVYDLLFAAGPATAARVEEEVRPVQSRVRRTLGDLVKAGLVEA